MNDARRYAASHVPNPVVPSCMMTSEVRKVAILYFDRSTIAAVDANARVGVAEVS
jgi:hypothetical protein